MMTGVAGVFSDRFGTQPALATGATRTRTREEPAASSYQRKVFDAGRLTAYGVRSATRIGSFDTVTESPKLSLNQWVILAIVVEQPTHGFAISVLVNARGELGQIWTIPRPLVYRALADLLQLGLTEIVRTELGANNVSRSIVTCTDASRAATYAWLDQPVSHVRDIRSALLVKLALLDRACRPPQTLLAGEQLRVSALVEALRTRAETASDFSGTLWRWRLHQAISVQTFLAEELSRTGPPTELRDDR